MTDDVMGTFLTWYYAAACAMNLIALFSPSSRGRKPARLRALWLLLAATFAALAFRAWQGNPLHIPEPLKQTIDALLSPATLTVGSFLTLLVFYFGRRLFVIPAVAWTGLNLSLVFLGASLTDPHFAAIVAKPDNVPIVAMVYLIAFFTWWATAQAVRNDDRIAQGLSPLETEHTRRVPVWPEVIYLELIGIVIATTVLIVWSLLLPAPLETPANPALTPNPSKAPWYFVGVQELLIYFDASVAGVVLPILAILGLAAIPYLDFNEKGNGYYTIRERPFAYLAFQFGFLQLWILLILIGTFMRGPNWSFFGLYEPRDPQKLTAMTNVTLSEYFWIVLLGRDLPQPPPASGIFAQLGWIAWREMAGLAAVVLYFIALPLALGHTLLHQFRQRLGPVGFTIMMLLLLMMILIPIKMILRWTLNLSYFVSIPEYFANF